MTRAEMLDFVRKNSTAFMATVENGEPRVRAMETPLVDDGGLVYCTGSIKPVCRQLTAQPAVELCFFDSGRGIQLRLRGRMEKLEDQATKEWIVENRFTFLKPVVEKWGWGALALFRLSSGRALVWSAADNAGLPEEYEF
jgi:uncharacterized pyridoxamine 5'-phosphate oxidase family protein